MKSDHTEDSAFIYLSLNQYETDVNLTILNTCGDYSFISFIAPFFGTLLSYTHITNTAYPDVYYTMYYVNETSLVPMNLESVVVKGYQELLVVFHVSVDSLLTNSQRLLSSRNFIDFEVYIGLFY